MIRSQTVIYGGVSISKVTCDCCGDWSFVVDGVTTCCGVSAHIDDTVAVHRTCDNATQRKVPTLSSRNKLLIDYDNSCAYCHRKFGTTVFWNKRVRTLLLEWDHLVPFEYSLNNSPNNFLPSCNICNGIKGSRVFHSIADVRSFVNKKWRYCETKKGRWKKNILFNV